MNNVVDRFVGLKKFSRLKGNKIIALLEGKSEFSAWIVCVLYADMVAKKQSRKTIEFLTPENIEMVCGKFSMYSKASPKAMVQVIELFDMLTNQQFSFAVKKEMQDHYGCDNRTYVACDFAQSEHSLLCCLMAVCLAGFDKGKYPRWSSITRMIASVLSYDCTTAIGSSWFYDMILRGKVDAAYARDFYLKIDEDFNGEYVEFLQTLSPSDFDLYFRGSCTGFGVVELLKEKERRTQKI